jgi:hypothetical protein
MKHKLVVVVLLLLLLCISPLAEAKTIGDDSKFLKKIKFLRLNLKRVNESTEQNISTVVNNTTEIEDNIDKPVKYPYDYRGRPDEGWSHYVTLLGFPSSWQDGDHPYRLTEVTYDMWLAESYYGKLYWNLKEPKNYEGEFTSEGDVDISLFGMEKSEHSYQFLSPKNKVSNAIINIKVV